MQLIVWPDELPFGEGGNAVVVESLVAALRERGHTVDLVALPWKWYPRESFVSSVLAWRLLDLTEANGQPIDLVIATKFPSYVVRHPRKVTWLVHQYRQAYDWFGSPLSDLTSSPEDVRFRRWLRAMDRTTLAASRGLYAI